MRKSGVLLPIFSLPGQYGIGCFSREAEKFVDFLRDAHQAYWQILPIGPTGYGDSPYQSFSTFAGNPYFIDPEQLIAEGLLTKEECDAADPGGRNDRIDYGKLYANRLPLLRKAAARSHFDSDPAFEDFRAGNSYWLDDYALFMAVKDAHGGKPLEEWEEDIAGHETQAVERWREKLKDDVRFYEFVQFEFSREWKKLKQYANDAGIRIIGDIPIYVSADSSDFWAHRELFKLDGRGRIREIAGVPPDGFSADGQLWGNPLYDWPYHEKTHFSWWLKRIGKCLELYDVLRIDHFRGFDEYFAIPASDNTAKYGHWEKGPGMALFKAIKETFGDPEIIAEDLGYLTDSVRKLVRDTGYPGMKVLEFAFDSRDSSGANNYLTYNYDKNCVVYTGTHDNETVRGWIDSIQPAEQQLVRDYLDVVTDDPMEIVDRMVIMAQSSVAKLCIIPLQDYLGLDNSARINHPSTMGANWQWRLDGNLLTEKLQKKIYRMTRLYGRL